MDQFLFVVAEEIVNTVGEYAIRPTPGSVSLVSTEGDGSFVRLEFGSTLPFMLEVSVSGKRSKVAVSTPKKTAELILKKM